MAYEKQLIAAMNNPLAINAWRSAQQLYSDREYYKSVAADWRKFSAEQAIKADDQAIAYMADLESAREENIALQEKLGEAYESIRERDMNFLDDVAKYADEAVYWKQRATERGIGFFVFVSILLVSVWVDLLTRLA